MHQVKYKFATFCCLVVITFLLNLAYSNLQFIGGQITLIEVQQSEENVTELSETNVQNEINEEEGTLFYRKLNRSHLQKGYYPYGQFSRPPQILYEEVPIEAENEAELNSTERNKLKKILYWNDSYGQKHFGLGFGQMPFLMANCRYSNCFTTGERDKFNHDEIDAVIWHFRSDDKSLPDVRFSNAKYVFFVAESAGHFVSDIGKFNNTFDLTFTYRRDSDIPDPYNILSQKDFSDETYITGDFSIGKTNIAAWFVSNCMSVPSGRNSLVANLMKYMEVDIYGECGLLKCPRSTTDECYQMAAKKYFFYLAFENSLCKDYITEKFFNALRYDFVPVVYGAGPYWKHAPPHSYIDALDFHSVEDLARYLIHLSQTPYEYNEYFRWKAYYFVLPAYTRRIFSICKLCEILNTKTISEAPRYDLQDWFVRQSDCHHFNSPGISNFLSGEKLHMTYNQWRCITKNSTCYSGP